MTVQTSGESRGLDRIRLTAITQRGRFGNGAPPAFFRKKRPNARLWPVKNNPAGKACEIEWVWLFLRTATMKPRTVPGLFSSTRSEQRCEFENA